MSLEWGGVILLPVNCIWEFFNLVYWKSQNCNLENCKNKLSCKLEWQFSKTRNLEKVDFETRNLSSEHL